MFHCSFCDKPFARPSSLGIHILIHSGEKPFECKYCKKRFNVLSNLRRHEKLHEGRDRETIRLGLNDETVDRDTISSLGEGQNFQQTYPSTLVNNSLIPSAGNMVNPQDNTNSSQDYPSYSQPPIIFSKYDGMSFSTANDSKLHASHLSPQNIYSSESLLQTNSERQSSSGLYHKATGIEYSAPYYYQMPPLYTLPENQMQIPPQGIYYSAAEAAIPYGMPMGVNTQSGYINYSTPPFSNHNPSHNPPQIFNQKYPNGNMDLYRKTKSKPEEMHLPSISKNLKSRSLSHLPLQDDDSSVESTNDKRSQSITDPALYSSSSKQL